jgi:hypothetical protein
MCSLYHGQHFHIHYIYYLAKIYYDYDPSWPISWLCWLLKILKIFEEKEVIYAKHTKSSEVTYYILHHNKPFLEFLPSYNHITTKGSLIQSHAVCVCTHAHVCMHVHKHIFPFPLLKHVTDIHYLMCRRYANDYELYKLSIFLPSNIKSNTDCSNVQILGARTRACTHTQHFSQKWKTFE